MVYQHFWDLQHLFFKDILLTYCLSWKWDNLAPGSTNLFQRWMMGIKESPNDGYFYCGTVHIWGKKLPFPWILTVWCPKYTSRTQKRWVVNSDKSRKTVLQKPLLLLGFDSSPLALIDLKASLCPIYPTILCGFSSFQIHRQLPP